MFNLFRDKDEVSVKGKVSIDGAADLDSRIPGDTAGTIGSGFIFNNSPYIDGPYADDTAAASGGIIVGHLYHTATGDVKVRLS